MNPISIDRRCIRSNTFRLDSRSGNPSFNRSGERGAALIVSLVLLLAVTLIGMASIRGTSLQEKMTANMNDRNTALQNAEAALRVAADSLAPGGTPVIARDCSLAANTCEANPVAWADGANSWVTVAAGAYIPGTTAAAAPQYIIENLGRWVDPDNAGLGGQTGLGTQYGGGGSQPQINYYRVTARSGDPDVVGDRSVVTLQAWVRG